MEFKIELNYEDIADICLKADGGYCLNCALDVARGFAEKVERINFDRLEKEIENKMEEYY